MKIYACNAFNSIMRFESIVNFIKPYLQQILKIYTSLLEVDITIVKNFEDLLALLEEDIAPFANDLVKLLIDMFNNYSRGDRVNNANSNNTLNEDEDNDDEEQ
jgi:hypothetical protein